MKTKEMLGAFSSPRCEVVVRDQMNSSPEQVTSPRDQLHTPPDQVTTRRDQCNIPLKTPPSAGLDRQKDRQNNDMMALL
jgi:hypothetical protein